jgi:hypothetical protein
MNEFHLVVVEVLPGEVVDHPCHISPLHYQLQYRKTLKNI